MFTVSLFIFFADYCRVGEKQKTLGSSVVYAPAHEDYARCPNSFKNKIQKMKNNKTDSLEIYIFFLKIYMWYFGL
jgi:hypothetical protein